MQFSFDNFTPRETDIRVAYLARLMSIYTNEEKEKQKKKKRNKKHAIRRLAELHKSILTVLTTEIRRRTSRIIIIIMDSGTV